MDKMFYRPKELAKAISVPENTIRYWARTGQLASKKVGHAVLIPAAEFERLTAGHDRTSPAPSSERIEDVEAAIERIAVILRGTGRQTA